jgi:hypothetical protein
MDFRQRLDQDRERPAGSKEFTQPEDNFTCDFFGIGNVGSYPACLDLRMPNGRHKALPYSYFMEMNFDPETGIEIITSVKKITITGRTLSKLFDYLVTYRVRYIQANIGNDGNEDGLFVKEIIIEELE